MSTSISQISVLHALHAMCLPKIIQTILIRLARCLGTKGYIDISLDARCVSTNDYIHVDISLARCLSTIDYTDHPCTLKGMN